MAELKYLWSLNSEKWFYIQGSANFTAAHFVAKCHTRAVTRGAQCPGRRITGGCWKVPTMSQFFFNTVACIYSQNTLGLHMGAPNLFFCPARHLTSIRPGHTVDSSQNSHLWRLHVSYSFGHYPRFRTIGKDRNKDRFEDWQLCGVWKLPFCDHRAIKLTPNCISFTNPCINILAPNSVTRNYHP